MYKSSVGTCVKWGPKRVSQTKEPAEGPCLYSALMNDRCTKAKESVLKAGSDSKV